jgi:copper oxidase (laccase) domain-containing protein
VVQLSPCIRPPFYEVDFAAQIVAQLKAGGVRRIYDCGENTGADLERFYSYRVERGLTGRMLAFLTLTEGDGGLGPSTQPPKI